jgi:hypothetical protein
MPMTIMKFFGFSKVSLSAACSAELQLANADVMFVLDTTGSMSQNVLNVGFNASDSKLNGLRDAVRDFYKTVANSVVDKSSTRIRFGFVPYSGTVNVKDLVSSGAMPMSYFADEAYFQTKLFNFNTPINRAQPPKTAAPVTEFYSSPITSADCVSYGNNTFPTNTGSPLAGGGPAPKATTSTAYAYQSWTYMSGSGSDARGICKRTRTVTTTDYHAVYGFTNYRFTRSKINVAAFKDFASVPLQEYSPVNSMASASVPTSGYYNRVQLGAMVGQPDVSGVDTAFYTWKGCIEERATVASLSMSPVPSGATDLDLDSPPTSDATKWRMYLDQLAYYRDVYDPFYDSTSIETKIGFAGAQAVSFCSSPAKQFTEIDTTHPDTVPDWLDAYLQDLVAIGPTYHDIGMIWGGRLASPNGIFADNVNADKAQFPSVSRHLVFMTDGAMGPTTDQYTAYGVARYDARTAPKGTYNVGLVPYHTARFLAACEKVKEMGYTVWVIGFGQSLTSEMKACSTAGRAYFAGDNTALKSTFKYIAGQVADLRVNK